MKRFLSILALFLLLVCCLCACDEGDVTTPDQTTSGTQGGDPDPSSCTHSYIDTVVPSTCKSTGYTEHVCSLCAHSYKDAKTPVLAHAYVDTVLLPTCLAGGYTEHACSACGDTYRDAETPMSTSHRYAEKSVTASCHTEGYTEHTCLDCGYSYRDNVSPKAHNWKDMVTLPDCIHGGQTDHVCLGCGGTYTDAYTEPTNEHTYDDTIVDPTCVDPGYTEHVCSVCNDTYRDAETEATEIHTYTSTVVDPTCGDVGYTEHVCSVCSGSYRDTEVEATGLHGYTSNIVNPTCGAGGYTEHTCSVCNDSYRDTETSPNGVHTYVATLEAPGCNTTGKLIYDCSGCDKSYEAIVPATHAHTLDDQNTCTACGSVALTYGYADGTATGERSPVKYYTVGSADAQVLVIYGEGAMPAYFSAKSTPWYTNTAIKQIVVLEGVTNIGKNTFGKTDDDRYATVTSIVIADSVKTIDQNALRGLTGIDELILGEKTERIEKNALPTAQSIRIYLPATLTFFYNPFVETFNICYAGTKESFCNIGIDCFGGSEPLGEMWDLLIETDSIELTVAYNTVLDFGYFHVDPPAEPAPEQPAE